MKCALLVLWVCMLWLDAFAASKKHHGQPSPSPAPSPSATPIPLVTLAWDPNVNTGNPDTDTAGYHLCMGFAPGNEPGVIDVGTATTWTLQLSSGTTYYFVVKAYNATRVDSLPSNEVSFTTPP